MRRQLITVKDANGASGVLGVSPQATRAATTVPVRLPSGGLVQVERDLLEAREEGSYFLNDLTFRDLESAALSPRGEEQVPEEEEVVVPIAEERARVRKQRRETGRVRIEKRVEEETETVEVPLTRERVDVERVPVGRVVDEPARTRREGQTVVVPVMEERLVVRKELVLKEELRLTVRQTEHLASEEVSLRRDVVDVQRTRSEDPSGQDAPAEHPPGPAGAGARASGE